MELFTIAVLTYQQRHHLEQCLENIWKQDYDAVELVICDDNSCDFSVDEVEAYVNRHKTDRIVSVSVYQQPYYAGEAKNFQTALEMAHGSYIKFLKPDEELADEKSLTKAAECFLRTGANVIVSGQQRISEDGKEKWEICPSKDEFQKLAKATPDWLFIEFGTHPYEPFVSRAAVYFRKQYLEKSGFDAEYTSIPYWRLWLEICGAQEKPALMDEVTVYKRIYVVGDDLGYMSYGMKDRHYKDCMHLLRDYVYPRLGNYTYKDRMRCRHAVEVIKIMMDERKWYTWKFKKRLLWKIRKSPTIFLGWLYRVRTGNFNINTYNEKKYLVLFSLLYFLKVSAFPDRPSDLLWASLAAAAFAILAVKEILKLCIAVARAVLNKRMKGKWWE